MESSSTPLASVEQARSIYRKLKADADEKRKEAESQGDEAPQYIRRLRSTQNSQGKLTIDLSKASRDCEHCNGTGRRPDHVEKDEDTGEETAIPVVCRCVFDNGGVAKDMFDRMCEVEEKRQKMVRRRKERRKLKRKLKSKRKRKRQPS